MSNTVFDIFVIGGGVNGCGIARDAAGRGLSVFLAEKDDLSSGTSSASTKLIHGGLRYLEHYAFGLVRESLREREILWGMAPHIIHPMRFVLPHQKGLRPAWLIRLGLFLYDHLGGRERLPGSHFVDLPSDAAGAPLRPTFRKAFEYSDCWVDDARLVVLNAMDAAARGAVVLPRTEVISARRLDGLWHVETEDVRNGRRATVRARALVNASGPWISDVIAARLMVSATSRTRLVKGSHIVVPAMFNHGKAYIFQNSDRRIVFAIPYQRDYTLIGTTDVDFSSQLEDATADDEEIAYLCSAVSAYFSKSISPDDVVWSYAGVRPLVDDGKSSAQEATRDYVLEIDGDGEEAVLLNVFGGKITTYRLLAEEVLDKLASRFPAIGPAAVQGAALPGGNFPVDGLAALQGKFSDRYPAFPLDFIRRLTEAYGTLVTAVLGDAQTIAELGHHFGGGLYQREVDYLVANEWAMTAEDIVWRRSKLGLRMTNAEILGLSAWLKDNPKLDSAVG